jgi:hypothetical protein
MISPVTQREKGWRETMVSFKGTHFVKDVMRSKAPHNVSMKRSRPVILTCVRWYLAYSLSYRQLEDRRDDAGTRCVRRSLPINRWVLKYAPQLEEAFHRRKRLVRLSRRIGMRPTSMSRASGVISFARWIRPARPLIPCSPSTAMSQRPALPDSSHSSAWGAGEDHHRWEWGRCGRHEGV